MSRSRPNLERPRIPRFIVTLPNKMQIVVTSFLPRGGISGASNETFWGKNSIPPNKVTKNATCGRKVPNATSESGSMSKSAK